MPNRLFIASTALTAAVAISAIAVSVTGTHRGTPAADGSSSASASHRATVSTTTAGVNPTQGIARAAHIVAAAANAPGGDAGRNAGASTAAGPSASTPTLLTTRGGAHALAGGAQKATPVAVSEDQAMQAIFKGGMWLPNANGGREYAKYDHHLIHDNGDWTWVGKVQTNHGPESAVITFGKDAVFGRIPQASGYPLRLVTADGQKLLVQTDGAKMAASAQNRQLYARQDFMVPQHKAASSSARASSASSRPVASASQPVPSAATASSGTTIDVMVAYTSGYASAQGGSSATLTRINNLVDVTNQAYIDSGVNQNIRLVYTMQVSYTDTNADSTALNDVTGRDGDGNILPVPSSLQGIASARTQYGADLVVLLRKYNNAGNGGCGLGWLLGGDLQGIDPSLDSPYGYSVVQDGKDGGFYCLDTTFAHELGHNMGSAHDRANADKDPTTGNPIPGAYSYSFGYLGNGSNGFATIMAYGSDTQTPVNYFSNPNISKCQNTPCGVSDTASNSADNAHSLNNTASLVAQFEPTVVTNSGYTHNDVNGDGKSDLFWYSANLHEMTYWVMNSAQMSSWEELAVPAGYQPVGVGDFDGDKRADILWTDSSKHLYMWVNNGSGGFTSHLVATYKTYSVVGVGDLDGDGKSDIIWFNKTAGGMTYWLMDGWTMKSWRGFSVKAINHLAGVGDFNGDGRADLLWAQDSTRNVYAWLGNSTGGFSGYLVNTYQPGWGVAGVGDADGDGKSDIFWYNQGAGQFTYWLINGASETSWRGFTITGGYRPFVVADYNGNGKADLLWTNDARDLLMSVDDGAGGFSPQTVAQYSANFSPFGD